MINRRAIIRSVPMLAAVVAGCSTIASTPAQISQVKEYSQAVANAVSASAQIYLAGPPVPSAANKALVTTVVTDIQAANAAVQILDGTNLNFTTAQQTVNSLIQAIQMALNIPGVQLALGAAGMYIPLALAVLEAFVNSMQGPPLPPPAGTPQHPPAALTRKAAMYHRGA
jgi:hypothetical protein